MLQAEQVLHGCYQLRQKLGQNASRQIWLAVDLAAQPKALVVVKLLAFEGEVQWDELKLFEREAQVLKQLNHPQIPKYRDYFCIDDEQCLRLGLRPALWFGLVQEYIPGSSLKELLNQGKRFTEQQVRKIAVDVLNILVYLHELNPPVLHRDIKPSNLIWGEDEQVYLVDFGAVQDKAVKEGATFTVVGTYGYTPMEQFGGRAVPASDLYALGATLIHLLTGTAPADLPQRDLQIQFADRLSSSPSMMCWLQQLVEPALEQRFSTVRLALVALESGLARGSSTGISLLKPSTLVNNSGQGGLFDSLVPVPEEIKGWNWGAFLLAPFWLLPNRVWIGLLTWVPVVGFWVAIALGVKGNEWAWKSRRWQSIDQFKTHQRRWAIAGIVLGISVNLIVWNIGILLLLSLLI
jgi:serine/threonine protein kinase